MVLTDKLKMEIRQLAQKITPEQRKAWLEKQAKNGDERAVKALERMKNEKPSGT